MLSLGMNFLDYQVAYLKSVFMQDGCANQTMFEANMYDMLNCVSNSDSVSGLPEFVLYLGHLQILAFNSSEYFIYPTNNEFDTPVNALFGLGYEGEDKAEPSNDTIQFGQLFVSKYMVVLRYSYYKNAKG